MLTEGEVFSSSALLNRYLPSVPPVAREWLSKFPHSAQEVNSWLDKAAQLTVLVAGEAITDEYIWVKALGKSGKEPILVVEELEREQHDGGATAVRKHVAAFAGKVEQWSAGEYLKKTRLVSRYPMQKMIELYSRLDTVLPDTRTLKLYDLVLVVDYGHGMIDSDGPVLAHDEEFLAVNVQNNAGNYGYNSHQKYERVDYLCLSESELRLAARQRNGDLRALVEKAAALHSAQAVTATRGDNGVLCWSQRDGFCEAPAFTDHFADRVGAGDAVLAVTSLLVKLGAPTIIVALVANAVGALAVNIVGNREALDKVALQKYLITLLK